MENQEEIDLKGNEMVLAGMDDASLMLQGKRANVDAGTTQARKEFLARLGEMSPKVRTGLKTGKLQLCEQLIYTTVSLPIGTQSMELFKEDDDISIGIRNVAKSRLEVDRPMVVSEVIIAFSATTPDVFVPAEYSAEFNRGEIDWVYNSFKVFEKFPLMGAFTPIVPTYNANDQYGRYKLKNPKLIQPEKRIEMTLKFPTASAAAASVKVFLVGISVKPFSKE